MFAGKSRAYPRVEHMKVALGLDGPFIRSDEKETVL
jgi:hypothetical protein